jgi:late competence protein required for DNA uptake (superfamily II DNA/RNA helicase)
MFKEDVSHYCQRCESESKLQNQASMKYTTYFCKSCLDDLLAESGKSEPIASDLWLDDWYKKEKERMKNAKRT